jgi:hypothetical protein
MMESWKMKKGNLFSERIVKERKKNGKRKL